jgi:hypothetical protein
MCRLIAKRIPRRPRHNGDLHKTAIGKKSTPTIPILYTPVSRIVYLRILSTLVLRRKQWKNHGGQITSKENTRPVCPNEVHVDTVDDFPALSNVTRILPYGIHIDALMTLVRVIPGLARKSVRLSLLVITLARNHPGSTYFDFGYVKLHAGV